MKKFLMLAFFPVLLFTDKLWAQSSISELSGFYQELDLGVDATGGIVTGYYRNGSELGPSDDEPQITCTFFLYGKKSGDKYAVQVWRPKASNPVMISGELSFLPPKKEKSKPSVRLQLSQMPSGCSDVNPSLSKPEGSHLGMEKAGDWIEVRMVKVQKAPFYESPDPSAHKKSEMTRGDVFEVLEKKPGWVRTNYEREKGWIKEGDIFPKEPPR